MILAAAACAEGNGQPPPELMLGWEMERFHALPEPGGLRDQIAGEMLRCRAALNVYGAFQAFRASNNWAAWAKTNKSQWAIVSQVTQLREAHGNQ